MSEELAILFFRLICTIVVILWCRQLANKVAEKPDPTSGAETAAHVALLTIGIVGFFSGIVVAFYLAIDIIKAAY